MFEHSLQNRKVICSVFFLASSPELEAGDAIIQSDVPRSVQSERGCPRGKSRSDMRDYIGNPVHEEERGSWALRC